MYRIHKIEISVHTAENLHKYIAELIRLSPWELLQADDKYYHRCNELYLLNLEREHIMRKLHVAERAQNVVVKVKFNRIALQVLINNIPEGVGCDGFIGEALKHVMVQKKIGINAS